MISYGKQSIDDSDIEAVAAVLRGQSLTCGPAIESFEAVIRNISGSPHAIAISNGTSALRLLYDVAGIGPGKRVAVPAITFVATASQAQLLGAEIVLLDVDPNTLLVTPEIVEKCTEHFDYLVVVDIAGRLCDLKGLAEICQRRGAILLQDAAHSFGSTASDGTKSGDCRHAAGAIFSFHPVKNITTGEGGAIVVANPEWDKKIRSARHHGIIRQSFTGPLAAKDGQSPWYHEFHRPSTNERMTDLQAALGISQSRRIEQFKKKRQSIIDRYHKELRDINWIKLPPVAVGQQPFWHLFSIQCNWDATKLKTRANFFSAAQQVGIALQVHYIPLHYQPVLVTATRASSLVNAEQAYQKIVSLPCYPDLSDQDQGHVISWLKSLSAAQTP
jgi:dTDP-4-amino-4,6-dideoxygalactose transaminase